MAGALVRMSVNKLSTSCEMSLKFAANLTKMFLEVPQLEDRFAAAKNAGFDAVELAWPYDIPKETLQQKFEAAKVENVLLNSWSGNVKNGDLGIAAVKGKEQEFKETLEMSIEYAKILKCNKMHIMAGFNHQNTDEEVYLKNIKYAAERLEKENILTLIEPINTFVCPNYFLTTQAQGVQVMHAQTLTNKWTDFMPQFLRDIIGASYIDKINHPNLKLQLDVFHVQFMQGDLTNTIKKFWPYVGHIQIAQVPNRHEPNYPGEINYSYIFNLLEEMGYKGHIGLEYGPAGGTVEGLKWLREMGFWK